jgi:hypothetical protein
VIQGEIAFFVGEAQERVDARAGSYAYVAPGAPHAIVVRSETAGSSITRRPTASGSSMRSQSPRPCASSRHRDRPTWRRRRWRSA